MRRNNSKRDTINWNETQLIEKRLDNYKRYSFNLWLLSKKVTRFEKREYISKPKGGGQHVCL
jgi:hypothetical protein